jgi:hypothetical protein
MHAEPTRTWLRRVAACGVAACGLAAIADAWAQQPAPQPPPPAATAADFDRPVAYIYGNVAVTRAEFGEFLMARGGADKLELFVNKKIIEHECAKRGVAVTQQEMEAALLEDLEGLSIQKADFVKLVLPRYGKTFYEWMEDVVRPRLLLTKLCRDRVQVTEDDLRKQFEREFGEKRKVQIIMWPKGDDLKTIQKEYAAIRESQDAFDDAAMRQSNPALASVKGHIQPVARHTYADEPEVVETAFKMQPGTVSHVIDTKLGYVVIKLHAIIPPSPDADFEKEKPRLHKQAYDERLSQEIPKYFAELKKAAEPNFIFTGPELWKALAGPAQAMEGNVLDGVKPAAPGLTPAGGAVIPPPSEKK